MPNNVAQKDDGRLTSALAERWLRWRARRGSLAEIAALDHEQREEIARDTGVAVADLVALIRNGPDAADLLYRRLDALDLDRGEVARKQPLVLRDLQRLCSMCESQERCAHDLDRDPGDSVWRGYCPNASTLTALCARKPTNSRGPRPRT